MTPRAAQFNGTNQFLSAANSAGLQAGGTNFFVACWARRGGDGTLTIAAKQQAGATREWILGYETTSLFGAANRFFFRTAGTGAANTVHANAFGAWGTGQWAFVLAWRDLAANRLRIRINGGAADEATPPESITATTAPLTLGASQASATPTFDRHFNGRLDQFVFGKPADIGATIADIHATLWNGGAGVSYGGISAARKASWGLVSFWALDEPSGVRFDAHGANHLSPSGSPPSAEGWASPRRRSSAGGLGVPGRMPHSYAF